jgi:hypothetical protein
MRNRVMFNARFLTAVFLGATADCLALVADLAGDVLRHAVRRAVLSKETYEENR